MEALLTVSANKRKRPTRERDKWGWREKSRGEKIRKGPLSLVKVGRGKRGLRTDSGVVPGPAVNSFAADSARWLLKFKDPTATASRHASGAQLAAP